MESNRISNLLAYLPQYRVVVCLDCQYAIQPNAFSTHLQRHKIFRGDRRELLTRLSALDLVQPTRLPVPSPLNPAIRELPVLDGYKCLSAECDYICTAEKRMRQHSTHTHRGTDGYEIDFRQAKVQTFFRGTHTRYFEVQASTGPADAGTRASSLGRFRRARKSSPCAATLGQSIHDQSAVFDTQALMYMHHYTIATAETVMLGPEVLDFWIVKVPSLAGEHPHLLYSLLGISACHKAVLAVDPVERDRHNSAAVLYQIKALNHFRDALGTTSAANSSALAATSRFLGIQEVALATSGMDEDDKKSEVIQPSRELAIGSVTRFLVLFRGSVITLMQAHEQLRADGCAYFAPIAFEKLRACVGDNARNDTTSDALQLLPYPSHSRVLGAMRRALEAMHSMTDITKEDVRLFKQCLDALARATGFLQESSGSSMLDPWTATMAWAISPATEELLIPALREQRPIALVVIAFFGLTFVKNVECDPKSPWFANGHSDRLYEACQAALSGCPGLHDLVADLRTSLGV